MVWLCTAWPLSDYQSRCKHPATGSYKVLLHLRITITPLPPAAQLVAARVVDVLSQGEVHPPA